ncbi:MAG: hypothetical protein R3F56_08055 [Planctomycetota bacterium]
MSDPLLVEAIETLFEPVAIRNNSDGDADARVREAFAEPAWNNPVVRIVDADRSDLAPRLHDDWSAAALVDAMVAARTARELAVPAWLRLVQEEEQSRRRGLERAVFAMGDKAEAG